MRAPPTAPDLRLDDAARVARTLAALRGLGLERVESPDVTTHAVRVEPNIWQVTGERPAMGTLVSVVALGPSRGLVTGSGTRRAVTRRPGAL
jgi:hypothetical protein